MSGHLFSIDGLSYYRAADRLVQAGSFTFDPPLVWDPGAGLHAPATPLGFSLALVPGIVAAFPLHTLQPALTAATTDQVRDRLGIPRPSGSSTENVPDTV